MNSADFQAFSALVRGRSGLALTEDKSYLLESRLMPVVRRRRYAGLEALAAEVRKGTDESLLAEVTEAMTTNETFFFRDTKPFDQFRDAVLPALKQARAASKTIRIWSAAASSGQEPYSLAMILSEMQASLAGWRFDIVATDISHEILNKARQGIYSQFEVQRGLPIQFLVKYFKQLDSGWQISESVRRAVQFNYFNLLDSMTSLGNFDVVFCRNVLIYFDPLTKTDVLRRICNQMAPDGYLYLGGAETVLGISDQFRPVQRQRGLYEVAVKEAQRAAV